MWPFFDFSSELPFFAICEHKFLARRFESIGFTVLRLFAKLFTRFLSPESPCPALASMSAL